MNTRNAIITLGVIVCSVALMGASRTTSTSTTITSGEFGASKTYAPSVTQTAGREHVVTDTLTNATGWRRLDASIPWADMWIIEANRDSADADRIFWVRLVDGNAVSADSIDFMASGFFQLAQPSDSSGTPSQLIEYIWIKNPDADNKMVYSVFKAAP